MNIHRLVQYIDALPEKIDSPTYTFLGNPEEEETILSKQLDLCFDNYFWSLNTSPEHVNVYICMYRRNRIVIPVCSRIREKLPVEYLSYFLEHSDSKSAPMYSFPSFQYKCDTINADIDGDDEDENAFKSACIDHIVSVRSLHQKGLAKHTFSRAEFDIGYKGFIADKNKAFAFFDADQFETYFSPDEDTKSKDYSANQLWATVDEIVHKKSVLNVEVDHAILRLFKQNPVISRIQYDGHTLDFPRQMYALIPEDATSGENNMDLKTETYPVHGKTLLHMSMALSYSYSDLFSERYLFTKEPLPEHHTQSRIYKRYACFIYNPRTVLDPTYKPHSDCIKKYPNNTIENLKMEAEDDDVAEQMRETPCIVFVDKLAHHKRIPIWGFLQYDYFDEILD